MSKFQKCNGRCVGMTGRKCGFCVEALEAEVSRLQGEVGALESLCREIVLLCKADRIRHEDHEPNYLIKIDLGLFRSLNATAETVRLRDDRIEKRGMAKGMEEAVRMAMDSGRVYSGELIAKAEQYRRESEG